MEKKYGMLKLEKLKIRGWGKIGKDGKTWRTSLNGVENLLSAESLHLLRKLSDIGALFNTKTDKNGKNGKTEKNGKKRKHTQWELMRYWDTFLTWPKAPKALLHSAKVFSCAVKPPNALWSCRCWIWSSLSDLGKHFLKSSNQKRNLASSIGSAIMICFAHKFHSHHSVCWGSWVGPFSETSLMQRAVTELAAGAQQHQENMKISPPLQPVPKFSSDGCPALECPKLECRSAECVRWVEEKDNGGKRHRRKTQNNRNSSWTRRRKQQEHVLFRNEKKRNRVACRQVLVFEWKNNFMKRI